MGQALVYDYDENGRLESATSPDGKKKAYSYDLDDRLETVRYFAPSSASPEKTVSFTYNAAGLVESWSDGAFSGSYEYDASGRKTKETVNYGSFEKSFTYSYHVNGLKKSFTDSESRQYSYSWDKAGRLEAINLPTGATVSYTGMVLAGPERVNLPGGSHQKISHDGFMRLSGQGSFDYSGSKTFERNYTRTATGNITGVSGPGGDYSYGYDVLDRLVSSDAPGTAMDENFAYDRAGNRVSASNVSGPIAHNSNNQTTQYGSDSFEYDANGNTIKMISPLPLGEGQGEGKLTRAFTWDSENRLTKVEEQAGAVIATYGYDPFGRRLWKDAKGVKTFFLYSDEGLIGEFDSSGNEIKSYGWKPGGTWGTDPVFIQKSGQYYFYHNDHLGTPRMMTSVSGNVVWKAEYEAFGKADVTVGVIENNLRFPGQYFDAETGLHYNWNRYYEPGVGRYISEDPIGIGGGDINFYGYVSNNPSVLSDPYGLKIKIACNNNDSEILLNYLSNIAGTKLQLDSKGYISGDFHSPKEFSEIEAWLKELINSDKTINIKFGDTLQVGYFNHGDVVLDGVFRNQTQETYKYQTQRSYSDYFFDSDKPKDASYTGEAVMAHELVGHGLDWVRGGPGSPDGISSYERARYEGQAIYRGNKVHELLGLPLRAR